MEENDYDEDDSPDDDDDDEDDSHDEDDEDDEEDEDDDDEHMSDGYDDDDNPSPDSYEDQELVVRLVSQVSHSGLLWLKLYRSIIALRQSLQRFADETMDVSLLEFFVNFVVVMVSKYDLCNVMIQTFKCMSTRQASETSQISLQHTLQDMLVCRLGWPLKTSLMKVVILFLFHRSVGGCNANSDWGHRT